MKIRLNKILKVLAGSLALTVLFSCADSLDIKDTGASAAKTYSASDRPVVKFTAVSSARTVLPENALPSQLTDYTVEYCMEDEGSVHSPAELSGLTYEAFCNASIEFERSDVNK